MISAVTRALNAWVEFCSFLGGPSAPEHEMKRLTTELQAATAALDERELALVANRLDVLGRDARSKGDLTRAELLQHAACTCAQKRAQ